MTFFQFVACILAAVNFILIYRLDMTLRSILLWIEHINSRVQRAPLSIVEPSKNDLNKDNEGDRGRAA